MKSSIHRLTLDMHKSQSQISIPVMLGDTSREFRIIMSDGGNPYLIEDGCLAKISIKRPTGTYLEDFCPIENNTTIVYDFSKHENTAAVVGIHNCDVSVYGLDGKCVTTARFTMVVSDRVISKDDVNLTDDDFTAVDAMIRDEALRKEAEKARQEAEEERINAGKVALKAAEDAQEAADKAENIATSLVTNTKKHLQGNGGTLNLEVEDGVIYHISGYNLINISAPSGKDYTSHLFVSFANNGQDVGFHFPEEMKVYGTNPSMVDDGDSWEVNVDNVGGALCLKKEVIT